MAWRRQGDRSPSGPQNTVTIKRMVGEFLYFLIYVAQQLGIMLGVGAQTVLLCAHLIAVHHGEKESPHAAYAEAARFALGVGLFLMIVSGLLAVVTHLQSGQADVVLSPAFLFKWALIIVLTAAFFLQSRLLQRANFYYAFTGATWYALFLVHSLGPVTSWGSLWTLYILWGILFTLVWWGFVALMRRDLKNTVPLFKPAVTFVIKKEAPRPVTPPALRPPSLPPPLPPPPLPPPAPLPISKPIPPPIPVIVPVSPPPIVVPAPPKKPGIMQEVIDHLLVPALRIMPQKPEDISKHNRPPVVKLTN